MDESCIQKKTSNQQKIQNEMSILKEQSMSLSPNLSYQTNLNDIHSNISHMFSGRNRNKKQSEYHNSIQMKKYESHARLDLMEKKNSQRLNLNQRNKYSQKLFQLLKIKQFAQKITQKIGLAKLAHKDQLKLFSDKTTFYHSQKHLNQNFYQIQNEGDKQHFKFQVCFKNYFSIFNNSNFTQNMINNINTIPAISPSGNFKFFWDVIMIIVILLYLFMIPIEITFYQPLKKLFSYYLLLPCNIALIIDFILQLNFGFFEKGQPNMNRIQIIIKYFRSQFYIDLSSSLFVLIDFYWQNDNVNYIHLLFFLRFKSIKKFFKRVEERFNLSPLIIQISSLVQLLLLILIVAHIIGCTWIQVARYEIQNNIKSIWINNENIKSNDWISNYIQAYYFSTVTMITVGYGDFTPQNPTEMIISIFTMLFSCGVFAYSINAIGKIFNTLNKKNLDKKSNLYTISQYMAKKNINSELQIQIKQYLEYCWDMQYSRDKEQEKYLINQLSPKLREQLLFETFKVIILECQIFKNNFSQQFLIDIIQLIEESQYRPDEIIVSESIQDEHSLYFIESGQIQVFIDEDAKKVIKNLNKGDFFGDFSFFTGQSTNLNYKATEFTQVFKIKRSNIFELFKNKPSDLEAFCNIKDNLLFTQNYSIIHSKCYYCLGHHLTTNCYQLFPQFNKVRIANISNKQVLQARRHLTEVRKFSKQPYFLYLRELQVMQYQFSVDFQQEIDIYAQNYTFKEDEDYELQDNEEQDLLINSAFKILSQQDLASLEFENKHTGHQTSYISQISFKKNKLSSTNFDEENQQQKISQKQLRPKTNSIEDNLIQNIQGNTNNSNYNITDQSNINQKTKRINKSILQIQPNLKIQCLISPRQNQVSDQQQLETLQNNQNNYHKRNSQAFDSKNSRIYLPVIKSDGLQGQSSDLFQKVQQILEFQNNIKEKKEKDEESNQYDIQKDYNTYLPHNNLSNIIEYLKFKSRFFKQLKFQYKNFHQNIKFQEDSVIDLQRNSIYNYKENYVNQYPFNNSSCQRNFQILRIFEKRSQQDIFRKKNSKIRHSQIQQIISNNQNLKNSLPNTKLQKLLEQFQFAQQNQNQNQINTQNYQTIPKLGQGGLANNSIYQSNNLNIRNDGECYQEKRKSSFNYDNKQLILSQRKNSNCNKEQKSLQMNLITNDQNMKIVQSQNNYQERKDKFQQTQKYRNNPSKNYQIQTQFTQSEISQIKYVDQDEIESPYSQKRNKINSSKKIDIKDKYFQSDFEEESPNKLNSYNLNQFLEEQKSSKTYIEQQNKKLQNFQAAKKQKRYKIDQILF
ncbi:hypothetical protein ABPG72_008000 [Tetrahymena utriculariae]